MWKRAKPRQRAGAGTKWHTSLVGLLSFALLSGILLPVDLARASGHPTDTAVIVERPEIHPVELVGPGSDGARVLTESVGGPANFGDAVDHGSLSGASLAQPVVGVAARPTGSGYWLVARDGGVFSFGDAQFFGSTGAIALNQPIVGIASTPAGSGYWLVASDGGIFSFGDAQFFGSTGAIALNQPIVGVAATPSGAGYWLIARDGGVFSFGDAQFYGSTGGIQLLQPITGGSSSPTGRGYWLVAADGGVFAFGDATFHGSSGGGALGQSVVGIAATNSGGGYWLAGAGGAVSAHGQAPGFQPAWAVAPVVGMARTPSGQGYWLATSTGGVLSGASLPGPGAGNYAFLSTNPANGAPVQYNPCSAIRYVINEAGAPPGAVQEVHEALASVAAMSGLSFQYAGSTTETHIRVGTGNRALSQGGLWAPILVSWVSAIDEPILAGAVLGYGGSASVWSSNPAYDRAYVTGEVLFDRDLAGLAPGFGPGASRGNLVLHELGHVVGLDHVTDSAQLMYGSLSGGSPNGFGAGDRTGLARVGSATGCLNVVPVR